MGAGEEDKELERAEDKEEDEGESGTQRMGDEDASAGLSEDDDEGGCRAAVLILDDDNEAGAVGCEKVEDNTRSVSDMKVFWTEDQKVSLLTAALYSSSNQGENSIMS